MQTTCTECGMMMEPHSRYIAGIVEFPEGIRLVWACDHHPQVDAVIRLGSESCVVKWVTKNPEYAETIIEMLPRGDC